MFDWQAPEGGPVLSPRFWVYWAVALPLTLTVFLAWLLWYQWHQKNDTFAENMRARVQRQGDQRPTGYRKSLLEKVRYPGWRSQAKATDEEKLATRLVERSKTAQTNLSDAETKLRHRVPTGNVTRADTIYSVVSV